MRAGRRAVPICCLSYPVCESLRVPSQHSCVRTQRTCKYLTANRTLLHTRTRSCSFSHYCNVLGMNLHIYYPRTRRKDFEGTHMVVYLVLIVADA